MTIRATIARVTRLVRAPVAPVKPSGLTLIIPDRPEIGGYEPPKVEGGHRCAALWAERYCIGNNGHPLWAKMANWYTDPAQLTHALALVHAAPEGARAVQLVGLHADTSWWSNSPPVHSKAWYLGWQGALDALGTEMRRMGFPPDTLIIGQSEHYPVRAWFPAGGKVGDYHFGCYNVVASRDDHDRWFGPDQVAASARVSMPGMYWIDHSLPFNSIGGIMYTMAACRAAGSELIPFITEPMPGEEKAWQLMLEAFAALGGVRRMVLFAEHVGDLKDHKNRIEAAWPVKAGG